MILQVSGRTDICALYPQWFVNRLKAGYVLVRNPYHHQQVSQIKISKDVVDCIAFCTKDPQNIMPYLKIIDQLGYKYYFMITITPYDYDIEPGLRPKLEIIKTFISLSNKIGKDKIMFEKMCQLLHLYTNTVIISFLDIYKNIIGKFNELKDDEVYYLAKHLGVIAAKYGLHIQTCSEKYHLEQYGIAKGSCIDKTYIEKLIGYSLKIKPNQNRANCSCLASIDIGAYSCCSHGCNHPIVDQNIKQHDEDSLMLIGNLKNDDKVTERIVASNKDRQLQLDIK